MVQLCFPDLKKNLCTLNHIKMAEDHPIRLELANLVNYFCVNYELVLF